MRAADALLTPEMLVSAYAQGVFPMAESRESSGIHWLSPDPRAVIPLEHFHVPHRLARSLRAHPFDIRIDTAFEAVIAHCAQVPRRHEKGSWINREIEDAYVALHRRGLAHSVESWEGASLVGGLYGVHLGGAFFGESMFSLRPNASKAALVALVARLRAGGFRLLDTQFVNDHLRQFGVQEWPKARYMHQLRAAMETTGQF